MHFIFALSALTAIASAAPTSYPETSLANGTLLFERDSINDCGDSTFEDRTSDTAPLVSDCLQIAENIKEGGTFEIGCGGKTWYMKASFGSCGWGGRCDYSIADVAYVGNQDIIDTINESINRFAVDGKVGSYGEMHCQSVNQRNPLIQWGVYNSALDN